MGSRTATSLLATGAAACGAAGVFIVLTVAVEPARPLPLLAVGCVTALAAAVLFHGTSTVAAVRRMPQSALAFATAGGALAFWAALLLAQSQRASDAPSGADTLFLTTTVWALCCVAAAVALAGRPRPWTALAATIGASAATAGLLASWETPSSFSPFAKFPLREALILTGGLVFTAGVLAIARAARTAGWRATSLATLAGAAVCGVAGGLVSLLQAGSLSASVLVLGGYLGLSLALFALGWVQAADAVGVARASTSLVAVPVLVMCVSFFESSLNVYGPSPVTWTNAVAATLAIGASGVALWMSSPSAADDVRPAAQGGRAGRVSIWLAVAAVMLAAVALFTPALTATASGGTTAPFFATWAMLGYESATGWLVFAAAGLALAAAITAQKTGGLRSWLASAVAAITCVITAIPLGATTLHTWNGWVPADVQQTYGTEYSRLVTTGLVDPARIAAAVLTLVALAVLAVASARRVRSN